MVGINPQLVTIKLAAKGSVHVANVLSNVDYILISTNAITREAWLARHINLGSVHKDTGSKCCAVCFYPIRTISCQEVMGEIDHNRNS
jgi:hypothetical protein